MMAVEESVFDTGFLTKLLGVFDERLRLFFGESHEVAPPDLEDVVNEAFEGWPIGKWQISLEDDPIKTGEHGNDQGGKLSSTALSGGPLALSYFFELDAERE
jgi:hypothetical protein